MKKIFFLLFILSMAIIKMSGQEKLKAQAPFQLYGTPADFNKLRVWEYLRLPKDTLSNADTGSVSYKNGYMYLKDATGHHVKIAKYSDIAGGGGTGDVDSVTFSPSQNVDTVKYWIAGTGYVAGVVDVKCGLVQPGTVVHDSLLKFTVSPSIHRSCLDGIRYTTTLTHITLGAADGTFGRYDVIALEGSSVVVVPGTPAAAPVLPQLSAGQTMLTFISIPATATVPSGPFTTIIYDENTEFTGSASGVTVDFGNFTDPYHLVKATSTGAVTSASSITYTGTDFKISAYNTLRFFIKLKAAFAQNTKFQISWLRDGVTQSGVVTMQNNTYGYLRSAGGYQEIIIPISDFGPFVQDTVDALKIQLTGSNASGFYLDYIQIQGGIAQAPTGTTRERFAVSGEDAVQTQNRYFNGRDQYFFTMDSIRSLLFAARETRFRYIDVAGGTWLQYTAAGMIINPLSTGIPLTFSNIPASDTAMYVLGINAAGRAVLQLKSAISGSTPTWQQVLTAGSTLTGNNKVNINNFLFELDSASQIYWQTKHISTHHSYFDFSPDYLTLQTNGGGANDYAGIFTTVSGSTRQAGLYASEQGVGSVQLEVDQNFAQVRQKNSSNVQMDLDFRLKQLPSGYGTKDLRYDASTGTIYVKDTVVRHTYTKALTLEFPTSSESFGVWKTPVDITISSVEAVLVGSSSPSVTFQIVFGSDRTSGTNVYSSGRTATSTTTGHTFNSSFNDATIPAGSFIWFTTSAQSGTVTNIEVTINYTED